MLSRFFLSSLSLLTATTSVVVWAQDYVHEAQLSDGAGGSVLGKFGFSLSASGETLVVGTPSDASGTNPGQVLVYELQGGSWILQDTLTSPSVSGAAPGDAFGHAVAVSGHTLVVTGRGAPEDPEDMEPTDFFGAAFVYQLDEDTDQWEFQQTVSANRVAGDFYGNAVALSGNRLAVGAMWTKLNSTDVDLTGALTDHVVQAGVVYTYSRNSPDGAFSESPVFLTGGLTDREKFGRSLALDDNLLLVGAQDHSVANNGGAVYVFTPSMGGYALSMKINLPADDAFDAHFGWSVAIHGNHWVAGSPGQDRSQGAVYTYDTAFPYAFGNKLISFDRAENQGYELQFGSAVALEGDYMAIGVPGGDAHAVDSGTIYVYRHTGRRWVPHELISASDGAAFDRYGYSLAMTGGRVMVGAYQRDTMAARTAGTVYVHGPDPPAPTTSPAPTPPATPMPTTSPTATATPAPTNAPTTSPTETPGSPTASPVEPTPVPTSTPGAPTASPVTPAPTPAPVGGNECSRFLQRCGADAECCSDICNRGRCRIFDFAFLGGGANANGRRVDPDVSNIFVHAES